MNYMQLLPRLTLPSCEQTLRFADHVAVNHSWYKHLPFFPPGAQFVFFLNPNAGRGVKRDGDEFNVFDLDDGNYFNHHSRLATADYVQRFGLWDYWVGESSRHPEPIEGPWIYDNESRQRFLLPDNLKRRWSCRLTAFLKPGPILSPPLLCQESRAFQEFAGQHTSDPETNRYLQFAQQVAESEQAVSGQCNRLYGSLLDSCIDTEADRQKLRIIETLSAIHTKCAEMG